ncbi:ComEC family competence protein [actinobacterium SCGC AAA044-D11]
MLALGLAIWLGAAIAGILVAPWSYLAIILVIALARIKRSLALILIAAVLTGSAGSAIRQIGLTHNYLATVLSEYPSVEIIGTLKTDPTWSKPKVIGSRFRSKSMTMLASISQINLRGEVKKIRLPVRITSSKFVTLIPGEKFQVAGIAFPTAERRVAALIATQGGFVKLSEANFLQRLSAKIRDSFRKTAQSIGGASGALIPGLVIGDTSLEEDQFVLDMRRVGLSHLTAVSGANFAIIAAFLLWLSQWIFKRLRSRLILTSAVLVGFIFLVRPSPSVLRASVMCAVILIAKARGVKADSVPSLGLAISFLILMDPFQAIDPGFALSVAATAGILLMAPRIQSWISERFGHEKFAEVLAIPLSATIMCTPVILAISGLFSLVSIPANILAEPVVAPITIIGFIAAILSPGIPVLAHLLLVLVKPLAQVIVWISNFASDLPVLLLPKSYLGAVIALAVIALIKFRKWLALGLSGCAVITIILLPGQWPGKKWEVANCNVGQGDGLAINLGNHSAIVVDVGPDANLMNACLKDLGITNIPLLVLSHFHADHVHGLDGVLNGRTISSIWVTNYGEPKSERDTAYLLLNQIPIHQAVVGESVGFNSAKGQVKIDVLWPTKTEQNFAAMPGDGSSINNSSIALLITVGTLRIFTAGDLEPPAQEALMNLSKVSPVDIYKVSHHGSAYQYAPLMSALQPKVALISVGLGNSYGHPAPTTVAAFEKMGTKVMRTDQDGAISVDGALKIRTKRSDWWNISWG